MNDESSGVETGPGWGWLAAAAAVGLWAARKHPRAAVAVGLGLAVWRCLSDTPEQNKTTRAAADSAKTPAKAEGDEADKTAGQGGWLLNLEPVPLVIHEEGVPAMGQGQGDGLLNQEPGQMVEELDWVPPVVVEEFWLNEGVEIPDAVELPELEEPSGTGAPGLPVAGLRLGRGGHPASVAGCVFCLPVSQSVNPAVAAMECGRSEKVQLHNSDSL